MNELSDLYLYDLMRSGDESAICNLVIRVFDEFNAAQYSDAGVKGFYNYTNPYMLIGRSKADHFVYTAKAEERIIGMIEVKECEHISLLFVDKQFQNRGIGKSLLMHALLECRDRKPEIKNITVNSSPFAVAIYEKLGFCIIGPDRTENGIYFKPMMLEINKYK